MWHTQDTGHCQPTSHSTCLQQAAAIAFTWQTKCGIMRVHGTGDYSPILQAQLQAQLQACWVGPHSAASASLHTLLAGTTPCATNKDLHIRWSAFYMATPTLMTGTLGDWHPAAGHCILCYSHRSLMQHCCVITEEAGSLVSCLTMTRGTCLHKRPQRTSKHDGITTIEDLTRLQLYLRSITDWF